ncbi:permease [Leucobacter sp. OLJS4]|uniref:purine-cytosine permease family protein n=1 Tax=unclassified Leucobacter TaxID=2621730 RepID=UPI000C199840|nr:MULTISPECIES: permease [unclassified Leucobacter]PII82374.1 permease [Leucobacter sp. OLCALW19]PII87446.1 permease [Leucobacter sp. OLTLW20]PII94497.1 permease [Leucobacter sp. OLAS13]PIJ00704.1 permease [Leucobacter sp. OLDS2]PIJ03338.1 permease [Leucobacter sp. OLIS6]
MSLNLTGSNDDVEATDALAREGNDDDQMSRGSLALAWYGVASAFFFVYIGAAMAAAYGTANAIIGIVLTIIVYGAINAVLSKYAINNRTTVAQFSRTILGTAGSSIATIIFALVAIYYAVFEGSIVAYALMAAFGGPMWLWSLVVVVYSTPLIIGGVRRFLDKLNGWLMPLYFFGLIAAVIWAGAVYGFGDAWLTHAPKVELPFVSGGPGWLATFAGYMGIWIMMMFTMDYAALGKRKDVKFHQRFTFGPLFYVLAYGFSAFVGIFLTFTIPGMEVSETGVAGGIVNLMGIFGLIVIIASQTRINTANYYLGAANLRAFGERVLRLRLPNIAWVLISSVIIFLLMLLPIVQYLLLALAWQGVLVTAWVAIALTHVLLDGGRHQEHAAIGDRHYRAFNSNGLISWIVGTVIGLIMLQLGTFDPALAGVGSTWGPILTAVSAAVVYALLWRVRPTSRTGLIPVVGAGASR